MEQFITADVSTETVEHYDRMIDDYFITELRQRMNDRSITRDSIEWAFMSEKPRARDIKKNCLDILWETTKPQVEIINAHLGFVGITHQNI